PTAATAPRLSCAGHEARTWSLSSQRSEGTYSITCPRCGFRYFAAEDAIDEHHVSNRQQHSKSPPNESEGKRMRPAGGVVHGGVQRWVGGRNQQIGINGRGRAQQHKS